MSLNTLQMLLMLCSHDIISAISSYKQCALGHRGHCVYLLSSVGTAAGLGLISNNFWGPNCQHLTYIRHISDSLLLIHMYCNKNIYNQTEIFTDVYTMPHIEYRRFRNDISIFLVTIEMLALIKFLWQALPPFPLGLLKNVTSLATPVALGMLTSHALNCTCFHYIWMTFDFIFASSKK